MSSSPISNSFGTYLLGKSISCIPSGSVSGVPKNKPTLVSQNYVLYFPISIILLYFLKCKCTKFENGKPSHLRITLHFPFFGTEAMLLTAAIVPAIRNVFGLKPNPKTDNYQGNITVSIFYKTNKKPKKQLNHY
jgi:hypothetical protein